MGSRRLTTDAMSVENRIAGVRDPRFFYSKIYSHFIERLKARLQLIDEINYFRYDQKVFDSKVRELIMTTTASSGSTNVRCTTCGDTGAIGSDEDVNHGIKECPNPDCEAAKKNRQVHGRDSSQQRLGL